MLRELTAVIEGVKVGRPATYTGQLQPLLSNAIIFGVDLYEAGIGEFIEELFVEQIASKGAIRATLIKHLE